jgi:hypothetical protein
MKDDVGKDKTKTSTIGGIKTSYSDSQRTYTFLAGGLET